MRWLDGIADLMHMSVNLVSSLHWEKTMIWSLLGWLEDT